MQVTKELIQRYHNGQCNAEESARVESWLESDEIETSFPDSVDLKMLENKGWEKISTRYHFPAQRASHLAKTKSSYRLMWQIAASIFFILGLGLLGYFKFRAQKSETDVVAITQTIKTLKGQKLSITLSDGTQVQMNSESILRFPKKFGAQSRQVKLEGEAFFKVKKDSSRPFTISTPQTIVRVLGTRFNLRAYAAESKTSVVVEEGSVRFFAKSRKDSLTLISDQRGVYTSGAVMKMQEVNPIKYLGWKDNKLIFANERLIDIAKILERWYDVEITIQNPILASERYTGQFDQADLKTVMESLSFAIKFNYSRKDKNYLIYVP